MAVTCPDYGPKEGAVMQEAKTNHRLIFLRLFNSSHKGGCTSVTNTGATSRIEPSVSGSPQLGKKLGANEPILIGVGRSSYRGIAFAYCHSGNAWLLKRRAFNQHFGWVTNPLSEG
ncbi:hypothetical protein DSO57_1003573 [Entomophthora muscae]|uniref:Uncharacterized protein n=1 Tax=Entomophthora muscae TaxID=34485 RepID=A0ACC2RZM8_9FUNG|nr:hypothetical protein DSO57_1003573 [Entomophthora muscae]